MSDSSHGPEREPESGSVPPPAASKRSSARSEPRSAPLPPLAGPRPAKAAPPQGVSASGAVAGNIRLSEPTGRWVVVTTVLGSGMALLDSTVVNVALPRIGAALHADMAVLQWTVNAYMLTLAGLILLGGALGDRFGRRRVFLVGVVWFTLASVMCGLAPNAELLIAARALQGIGGALLTPGSLALIQSVFHPDERARAVGAWSGFGGVAAAVGPFLGGWLVAGPGWRWVFLLNVPIAALCVPIALRHVPETRQAPPTAPYAETPSGRRQARQGFDVAGAALGALSLGGITYSLIAAPEHGVSPAVLIPAVGGLLGGAAFVWLERRRPNPMLPPQIFANRLFTAVNAVTFCVYAAIGGFFFLSVIQLQVVLGYSPLAAGTALLPTTLLMLLLSARSGELGQRIGPRIPLTAGPLLCAAGMLLMTRATAGSSYWTHVLPALLVFGMGLVLLVAPLTATVLASVEVERAGLASGINNAVARAASLIAVAALPLLAGMGPHAYQDAGEFGAAFRRAMLTCAVLLVLAALFAWVTVQADALAPEPEGERRRCHPECHTHCAVAAPPLDPGDARSATGPDGRGGVPDPGGPAPGPGGSGPES